MDCGDGSDLNAVVLERDSDFMNFPGRDLGKFFDPSIPLIPLPIMYLFCRDLVLRFSAVIY